MHDPAQGDGRDNRPLVLVIDDDPSIVQLLTKLLQSSDFRTTSADSGPTGISIAEKYAPNIILLDLMMEGMDGIQTCEELKSRYATADIPVVFLTAQERTDEIVQQCFAAGGNDFLNKPFSRIDLLLRIQVVLREQAVREAYKRLATCDTLTALSNRRQTFVDIADAIASSKRDAAESLLFLIDIDGVAGINERHGYDLGDEVILTCSRLVKRFAAADCRIGRIGGDEFAIVVKNLNEPREIAIADRLRNTFSAIAFDAETDPKHFSLSIGLARYDGVDPAFDVDKFVAQADIALLTAKRLGRGRIAAHWRVDPNDAPELTPQNRHSRSKPRSRTHRAYVAARDDAVEAESSGTASAAQVDIDVSYGDD